MPFTWTKRGAGLGAILGGLTAGRTVRQLGGTHGETLKWGLAGAAGGAKKGALAGGLVDVFRYGRKQKQSNIISLIKKYPGRAAGLGAAGVGGLMFMRKRRKRSR